MTCSLGSDECPSEPQFPLCTCGALSTSPASVPRRSFSSAHPSSPVRGDPIRFSLWGEKYRELAAFDQWEGKLCPSYVVLCEPPAVSAAHLHPLSSCVCWGRHHHHRRHDLTSCLQNRLHHLYWGRRPHGHRSRR